MRTEDDLFGGVVPHPFVATKAITHPLVEPDAAAPEGWSHGFARRVRSVVLPGFTAFTLQDARKAGLRLLERGPVRLKPAAQRRLARTRSSSPRRPNWRPPWTTSIPATYLSTASSWNGTWTTSPPTASARCAWTA